MTKQINTMNLVERLREWAQNIRRKPAPLSDAIPMVCEAADRIEALEAVLREAREALQKSTPLKRYDDDDYFERSWEVHKQAIDRIDEVLGEKK